MLAAGSDVPDNVMPSSLSVLLIALSPETVLMLGLVGIWLSMMTAKVLVKFSFPAWSANFPRN